MIVGHPMKEDGTPNLEMIVIGITYADCMALLAGKTVTQTDMPKEAGVRSVLVAAGPDLHTLAAKLRDAFRAAGRTVESLEMIDGKVVPL